MRKKRSKILPVFLGLAVVAALLMVISPVRERVLSNFNELRVQAQYALNPPQEAVFVPNQTVDEIVQATMQAIAAVTTPTPTAAESPATLTPTPEISPTPTLTATPLPGAFSLQGLRYQTQHGLWNYCAPANLAMALSFWGWEGESTDIGPVVKPFDKDKNVMPYELADYVNNHTNKRALVRSGGSLDLIKQLVANEFVVLIEKGIVIRDYNGRLGWMGHYAVVTGYDDASRNFITQDSYFTEDYKVSYDDLLEQWRSFNYLFLVVYSPEEEIRLFEVLGAYSDPDNGFQVAAQTANEEAVALSGVEQFFAYFNRGSSLAGLQDYAGAATAYDQAFTLMAALPEQDRPWRIMWYQTGPYFAYYYTGRYFDVERLATNTIDAAAEPYIEESFVWRARARIILGDNQGAIEDVKEALEYHPGFPPAIELANQLGIQT